MIRRLLTFLSVVSLLLCAATVLLWRESYSVSRSVMWNGTIDYWIVSNHGLLRFIRTEWVKPASAGMLRQAYNEEGVFSGETRPYTGMDDCAPTASQLGWQIGLGSDQHPFGDGIE